MGLDCIPRTTASSFPTLCPSPHNRVAWMLPAQGSFSRENVLCAGSSGRGAPGGVCTRGANFGGHGAWGRPAHSTESPAGLSGSIKTQQGQPRAKWADEGRGLEGKARAREGSCRGAESSAHEAVFSEPFLLWETVRHFLKNLSRE